MKKKYYNDKLIKTNNMTDLLRIRLLTKRLSIYGKNLKLNQTDLDCLYNIFVNYMKLIERCRDYE